MRGWNEPKMTREERALWQKSADDSRAVTELLYSLLKFTVELKMPPDGMKGLQEAIKSTQSFRDEVERDLARDAEQKK
jgi:hypothetical protein